MAQKTLTKSIKLHLMRIKVRWAKLVDFNFQQIKLSGLIILN